MSQPKDYDPTRTDPGYRPRYTGGYVKPEPENHGDTLKWVAGVLGSITAGALLFLVSCTFNKVDTLSGDMREVKAQLKLSGEQYDRDRNETNRRLRELEQRGGT